VAGVAARRGTRRVGHKGSINKAAVSLPGRVNYMPDSVH